ncbi:Metal-dependent hydrolase, endonuclease/exonuclease/phosphatase family [Halogeometricum rufum]|uniref:Metal-dependent hydrolase, endonuclease/exonuclease/phosphatase family n=1 Tax=Halogeometricum rufum TaxID=553469 RepID=A0A1I6IYU2_9EURY|nr:endonuclease/exonuclease/phosphatase family protein [Halogeometricum rufum]SFR71915.1 Metal-dependent hydrolase, endonuclease/exonuclease/phosphatase family [Halogeometricum rufum]
MTDFDSLSRRETLIGAGTALGATGSLDTLGRVFDADGDDFEQPDGEGTLAACSFNVRYDNPEDDYPWTSRLPRVAEAVDRVDPELLGVQEAQPNQFTDLRETISDYDWYGIGREGGDESEAVPVAWSPDRFDVRERGVFWLSPTPDTPSVGWGAENPRISTWVGLTDVETGADFWFCNTHFSHVDAEARRRSAEIVRERASRRAEDGEMVVVTGDLNSVPTAPPYHVLTGRTGAGPSPVVDGRREAGTASVYGPWGTYHGFTDELEDRIDYVFTPAEADVLQYRTLGIREGAYRSDHLPVVTHFEP